MGHLGHLASGVKIHLSPLEKEYLIIKYLHQCSQRALRVCLFCVFANVNDFFGNDSNARANFCVAE